MLLFPPSHAACGDRDWPVDVALPAGCCTTAARPQRRRPTPDTGPADLPAALSHRTLSHRRSRGAGVSQGAARPESQDRRRRDRHPARGRPLALPPARLRFHGHPPQHPRRQVRAGDCACGVASCERACARVMGGEGHGLPGRSSFPGHPCCRAVHGASMHRGGTGRKRGAASTRDRGGRGRKGAGTSPRDRGGPCRCAGRARLLDDERTGSRCAAPALCAGIARRCSGSGAS